jgi:hypothetical protein
MADDLLEGLEPLLKRMTILTERGQVSVLRSALRGGMKIIATQMKADLSPKVKQAKRAIKSRFEKARGNRPMVAKVGVGVGKRRKPKTGEIRKVRHEGLSAGVGIGPQNIHWWVAGTKQRTTGKQGRKGKLTGNAFMNRGAMPAMQPGLARRAAQKKRGQIKAAMIERGALQLKKEILKLQKIK